MQQPKHSDIQRPIFRRLHLWLFALFIGTVCLLAVGALWTVNSSVDSAARLDLQAEYQELIRYQSEFKVVGLADAIDYRISLRQLQPTVYLLERANGNPVVGNVDQWPAAVPHDAGWYRFKLSEADGTYSDSIALVKRYDNEFPILLARRLSAYNHLKTAFLPWLVGGIALIGSIALLLVFRSHQAFQRRIDALSEVLVKAGRGELDARIDDIAFAEKDEIAFLASQVNTTLDENLRLITGLEAVSQTAAHELNKELSYLRDVAIRSKVPELVSFADETIMLLREILDLSKIAASTDALVEQLDLSRSVQAAVDLYQDAYEDAGITLDVRTEPVMVLGQAHLLTNAVANLLSNALRHAPKGSVVLVAVQNEQAGATVKIQDQGSGTKSDSLREVLEDARTGKAAGYGFGLRFVQAVAIRHGAKLQLSNQNPGLRVTLTFAGTDCA